MRQQSYKRQLSASSIHKGETINGAVSFAHSDSTGSERPTERQLKDGKHSNRHGKGSNSHRDAGKSNFKKSKTVDETKTQAVAIQFVKENQKKAKKNPNNDLSEIGTDDNDAF